MSDHSSDPNQVTAFAPATVGNVGVGFDVMGFSFPALGDEVTLTRAAEPGLVIESITAANHLVSKADCTSLPTDPRKNTATAGIVALLDELRLPMGFTVDIKKGIPLAAGMGGSAASSVAALVALNEFLNPQLSREELLRYALLGEEATGGAPHPDNVTPCLYGGLTFTRSMDPMDVVSIPLPTEIFCVLVYPHLKVPTPKAQKSLDQNVPLATVVKQTASLGGFLSGCFLGDIDLIKRSFTDWMVEPQRAKLIPGFEAAKAIAMEHGALGCSISGSGPSLFAWAASETTAMMVQEEITAVFKNQGTEIDSWISPLSPAGARIVAKS